MRGFHSATLWVNDVQVSSQLLVERFGYVLVGDEGRRRRFQTADAALGSSLDLLDVGGQPRGQAGAGTVHHIAFRTPTDVQQEQWQRTLLDAGFGVTEVRDRQYFHSIYFREPNGVLYEIATDPPGFTADETPEMLGMHLRLPPWLEPRRAAIEAQLPELHRP